MPQTFTDVIELLLPELKRRGMFWDGYAVPGGTYRENLNEARGQKQPRADHPAAGYTWRGDEEVTNGFSNGVSNAISEHLDPTSMQLY